MSEPALANLDLGPTFPADEHLDYYLDGLLSPAQAAAFEAFAAARPHVQEAIALQGKADASLKAAYSFYPAPSATANLAPAPPAPARTATSVSRAPRPSASRWRPMLLAASLLLGVAGVWSAYVHFTTPTFAKFIEPTELYAQINAGGFTPEFICTDDVGFAKAVADRLGTALHMTTSATISPLGWAYGNTYQGKLIGDNTLVMLARSGDANVLVLMDHLDADRPLKVDPDSGLSLFRSQIGPIVLYEISPLKQPTVLPTLHE